jgi:hypothetical protein
MQDTGYLNGCRHLLHDRDQFCREFRATLAAGGAQFLPLPARSPNLKLYAERWVRSIKEECLSQLSLFGERSLQRVVSSYLKIITRNERRHVREARSIVESGSVAYSNITSAPLDYFYHKGYALSGAWWCWLGWRRWSRQPPRLKALFTLENADCLSCDLYRPFNDCPRSWRIDPCFLAHCRYRALERGTENLDLFFFAEGHGGFILTKSDAAPG